MQTSAPVARRRLPLRGLAATVYLAAAIGVGGLGVWLVHTGRLARHELNPVPSPPAMAPARPVDSPSPPPAEPAVPNVGPAPVAGEEAPGAPDWLIVDCGC